MTEEVDAVPDGIDERVRAEQSVKYPRSSRQRWRCLRPRWMVGSTMVLKVVLHTGSNDMILTAPLRSFGQSMSGSRRAVDPGSKCSVMALNRFSTGKCTRQVM